MADQSAASAHSTNDTELLAESLVEEVSIDGMCGVY
ncbi:mycofactocin precursor MftA [Gordonia lacunae]|uniref:Mycofactocin n=1 Tax=Gordonia lacunae TaxID=417102 RepID=A0A243Q681_9ACTN|nr:mycofactocin precursor MftA [Gordonia lacunae]OUC76470.1 mycofactocin precursor [Gordonia lacunae]